MELGRNKLLAVALAAATGGPYLMSMTTDKTAGEKRPAAAEAGSEEHAQPAQAGHTAALKRTTRVITHKDLPLEGLPARNLEEVFRFDIQPGWIMSRWGRVFTSPATEEHLRGYRVPLVTGTADFDLAGSLTYYFDREQKCQRITFVGHTGNTQPVVALAEKKYHLLKQKTDDPGLQIYQIKHSGHAESELRIEPNAVVYSGEPHARYKVELWLKRPEESPGMFTRDAGEYSDRLWPQR